jgi:Putative Ig domain
MLGGCLGSGGGSGGSGESKGNQPPTIAGVPPPATLRREKYEFLPSASDPDGDRLRFSIRQKPPWARFDHATGRIYGQPQGKDVGEYIDIKISVTDGKREASLPPFSITVYHSGDESATLSWLPPTENADGSVLTDLNGYYIYIGQTPDVNQRIIRLGNEGLTRYVVEKLYPSTWYFAMSAYNKQGHEGRRTPVVSKTID